MTPDQDTDEDWADGGAIDFETVDNTKMKTEYNSNISTQKKRRIQKNT